jgi:hypothetical protein
MNAAPRLGDPEVIWLPMTKLVPIGVQLAFTRQDAKERGREMYRIFGVDLTNTNLRACNKTLPKDS